MRFEYRPTGVCSQYMTFDIDDNNIITYAEVIGGCNGNLKAICKIITGMNIDHVIEVFKGNTCGYKKTSCADQMAKALEAYKAQRA